MNKEEIIETIIDNIKNYFIKNSTLTIRNILKEINDFNYDKCKVFEDFKEYFNINYQNITIYEELNFNNVFSKDVYDPNDYNIIINFIVYDIINYYSDYTKNIIKLDNKKTYYSSYNNDITIENFYSKKSCWFSEQEDQALLFQLERSKIDNVPTMFEFKLNNNPNVIIGSNILNDNIPQFFGIHYGFINFFLNDMGVKNAPDKLSGDYNMYILYICEGYNRYLQSNKYLNISYELLKINGYCNATDQHEIALSNFNSFVDNNSIIKYVFTKIVNNCIEYSIPLKEDFFDFKEQYNFYTYKEKFNDEFTIVSDEHVNAIRRMSCGNYSDIQIHYKNELSDTEKIYDCKNYPESHYWRKKYLKYKNKYLTLKK